MYIWIKSMTGVWGRVVEEPDYSCVSDMRQATKKIVRLLAQSSKRGESKTSGGPDGQNSEATANTVNERMAGRHVQARAAVCLINFLPLSVVLDCNFQITCEKIAIEQPKMKNLNCFSSFSLSYILFLLLFLYIFLCMD